jgi:hypothetical protein
MQQCSHCSWAGGAVGSLTGSSAAIYITHGRPRLLLCLQLQLHQAYAPLAALHLPHHNPDLEPMMRLDTKTQQSVLPSWQMAPLSQSLLLSAIQPLI